MNLSYWEQKSWFSNIDFTVVGSGIVGLTCALELRAKYPNAHILILEKGSLPQGASTKNAGFACFGSISEMLADLKSHSEDEIIALVNDRWEGIKALRSLVGDEAMGYEQHGGYELFMKTDLELYNECKENIKYINTLLRPIFKGDAFTTTSNRFKFKGVQQHYILQNFEGQIDTGKMMKSLLRLAQKKGITVLNATRVKSFKEVGDKVQISTDDMEFKTKKMFIATNGFAAQLLNEPVKPARAQVLITKPIPRLQIKGTFHVEEGYYYFRNIDDRILLGGGRNLDFTPEETSTFGETSLVQNKLYELLQEVILPNIPFEIDYAWSGIMGVGPHKHPIVKTISDHVACGVRLGGMGIAIGTSVGQKLANSFQEFQL